jgi:hypothetical protein
MRLLLACGGCKCWRDPASYSRLFMIFSRIHDPKGDHGGGSISKLFSQTEQTRIPRKSVPGAEIAKNDATLDEITAHPCSGQEQNDHVMSKSEHMLPEDPGDG